MANKRITDFLGKGKTIKSEVTDISSPIVDKRRKIEEKRRRDKMYRRQKRMDPAWRAHENELRRIRRAEKKGREAAERAKKKAQEAAEKEKEGPQPDNVWVTDDIIAWIKENSQLAKYGGWINNDTSRRKAGRLTAVVDKLIHDLKMYSEYIDTSKFVEARRTLQRELESLLATPYQSEQTQDYYQDAVEEVMELIMKAKALISKYLGIGG